MSYRVKGTSYAFDRSGLGSGEAVIILDKATLTQINQLAPHWTSAVSSGGHLYFDTSSNYFSTSGLLTLGGTVAGTGVVIDAGSGTWYQGTVITDGTNAYTSVGVLGLTKRAAVNATGYAPRSDLTLDGTAADGSAWFTEANGTKWRMSGGLTTIAGIATGQSAFVEATSGGTWQAITGF